MKREVFKAFLACATHANGFGLAFDFKAKTQKDALLARLHRPSAVYVINLSEKAVVEFPKILRTLRAVAQPRNNFFLLNLPFRFADLG